MPVRRKKRQSRKGIIILTLIAAIAVVAAVVSFYLLNSTSQFDRQIGQFISSSDYAALRQVSGQPDGAADVSLLLHVKNYTGSPLLLNGRPIMFYIGAEYCPFCAFQRWPLILALMRFGNFSSLKYMATNPNEGDIATFTFEGSTYTSNFVVFSAFELQDRFGKPLETAPPDYMAVFSQFGSGYPFTDFANRYVLTDSFYYPTLMQGKNWTQITSDIRSGGPIGTQVSTSANVITALICATNGNQPHSVCGDPTISSIASRFGHSQSSPRASFNTGKPIDAPTMWAMVQYAQIEPITNSSTNTRYTTKIMPITQSGTRSADTSE